MTVTVYGKDREYYEKLSIAGSRSFPGKIEFECLEKKSDPPSGDLILTDTECPPEGDEWISEPDGELVRYPGQKSERAVCKYRGTDEIIRDIIGLFSALHGGARGAAPGRARIVCFTSPEGGSGVSSVAAAYAFREASAGQRCFFLSLDGFPGALFAFPDGPDLSDAVFALSSRTNRNYRTVSGLFCRDRSGVSFISPPRRAEDMSALTPDILSELVGLIAESGDFDCVVIDAFFVFGGCGERAVRISDAVCAVCAGDKLRAGKITAFLDWSRRTLDSGVRLIMNFWSESRSSLPEGSSPSVKIPDLGECDGRALVRGICSVLGSAEEFR